MVPDATFASYYGKPILRAPVWKAADIAGYFFLGGLAGTASVLAAGADLTGRSTLARGAKVGAIGAISLGLVALVHDLGKPSRFVNMLRVFKPTSPMSVGSWVVTAYTPAAAVAAATAVTGRWRPLGAVATASAAALGPVVASYTGALLADTAVPAWHDAHRELPLLFAASAVAAGAGFSLVAAPIDETAPARRAALVAAAAEALVWRRAEHRLGEVAEPYRTGKGGALLRAARVLTAGGAITGAVLGRRSRVASALAGASLLAGSLCAKLGVFHAGVDSANDPKYTVAPQRRRVEQRDSQPALLARLPTP
jgi:formate-dependent nitrite reductase membrane component NrfD